MGEQDLKIEKTEKKNGGRREGSGRKKKEIEIPKLRQLIKDYLSEDEVKELIEELKKQAKKKPELLKFILEQVFGKAAQQVEMSHSGQVHVDVDIKKTIDRVYGVY